MGGYYSDNDGNNHRMLLTIHYYYGLLQHKKLLLKPQMIDISSHDSTTLVHTFGRLICNIIKSPFILSNM